MSFIVILPPKQEATQEADDQDNETNNDDTDEAEEDRAGGEGEVAAARETPGEVAPIAGAALGQTGITNKSVVRLP